MPKMKTHRGAAKRVKRTASGQLKRSRAFTSHLFANKSTKQKRQLRKARLVSKSDMKRVKTIISIQKIRTNTEIGRNYLRRNFLCHELKVEQ